MTNLKICNNSGGSYAEANVMDYTNSPMPLTRGKAFFLPHAQESLSQQINFLNLRSIGGDRILVNFLATRALVVLLSTALA